MCSWGGRAMTVGVAVGGVCLPMRAMAVRAVRACPPIAARRAPLRKGMGWLTGGKGFEWRNIGRARKADSAVDAQCSAGSCTPCGVGCVRMSMQQCICLLVPIKNLKHMGASEGDSQRQKSSCDQFGKAGHVRMHPQQISC
mmetsp:Transcript_42654/g.84133  ORF Transcript_42654/g.84133 Transcript_42654/m.84133 type:complete len:141 (-) Transcript_42654:327-749(-)